MSNPREHTIDSLINVVLCYLENGKFNPSEESMIRIRETMDTIINNDDGFQQVK